MSEEPSTCKKSSRLRPLLGDFPPTFHVATNILHPNYAQLLFNLIKAILNYIYVTFLLYKNSYLNSLVPVVGNIECCSKFDRFRPSIPGLVCLSASREENDTIFSTLFSKSQSLFKLNASLVDQGLTPKGQIKQEIFKFPFYVYPLSTNILTIIRTHHRY